MSNAYFQGSIFIALCLVGTGAGLTSKFAKPKLPEQGPELPEQGPPPLKDIELDYSSREAKASFAMLFYCAGAEHSSCCCWTAGGSEQVWTIYACGESQRCIRSPVISCSELPLSLLNCEVLLFQLHYYYYYSYCVDNARNKRYIWMIAVPLFQELGLTCFAILLLLIAMILAFLPGTWTVWPMLDPTRSMPDAKKRKEMQQRMAVALKYIDCQVAGYIAAGVRLLFVSTPQSWQAVGCEHLDTVYGKYSSRTKNNNYFIEPRSR